VYETGAPPAPPPPPDHHPVVVQEVPVARPARSYDATTAILPGPPPGTTTYRLRGTETAQDG
jgi:hypothetical protein